MKKYTLNIVMLVVGALLCVWLMPRKSNALQYEVGRPWKYAKLIAPFDLPVRPDSLTISQSIDSINANYVFFYRRDAAATERMNGRLNSLKMPARLHSVAAGIIANGVVSDAAYTDIMAGRMERYRRVEGNRNVMHTTDKLLSPRAAYQKLQEESKRLKLTSAVSFGDLFEPNLVQDTALNNEWLRAAYDRVSLPHGMIVSGQTIVDQGEVVSPQLYVILQTYEEMQTKHGGPDGKPLYIWIGKILFMGTLFVMLGLYMATFRRRLFAQIKALGFIVGLVTLFGVLAFVMSQFFTNGIYVLPLAIIPIMLTVFFDTGLAIFTSLVAISVCSIVAVAPLEFMVMQLVGTTIAVTSLKELSRRSQLVRTAFFVFVGYVVVYVAMNLMLSGRWSTMSPWMIATLAINMVFISFAYVFIFVIERWLGFTSLVGLVELSDINHPLLRELSRVCPGTFQHSMAVSNLAGEAAEKLGANVQLIRAGALYHDIGKIDNPAFFTENQHGVNPHDALDPMQSARIITGHVPAGLRRADKANLPKVIRDFIAQHHGRGVARYFYITYCNQHPDEEVDRAPFTYVGPNPQTLESSILMMADAVEAASRSLKEYDRDSITTLVNKIIDAQIADGLHAESPLSFRDVKVIKDSFIQRLLTIYHSRIAYPTAKK